MNFGAFNSPEDNILFDINDFDETLPGVDFTIDVKRLAAIADLRGGRFVPKAGTRYVADVSRSTVLGAIRGKPVTRLP